MLYFLFHIAGTYIGNKFSMKRKKFCAVMLELVTNVVIHMVANFIANSTSKLPISSFFSVLI